MTFIMSRKMTSVRYAIGSMKFSLKNAGIYVSTHERAGMISSNNVYILDLTVCFGRFDTVIIMVSKKMMRSDMREMDKNVVSGSS